MEKLHLKKLLITKMYQSEKIRGYKANGYNIIIFSNRENNIPHDEVIAGKPWCDFEGFYIDNRSIII